MLLKVCGVRGERSHQDIEMLAAGHVDLVGLWHGVPGGEAELSRNELVHLARVARDHGLEPVLVTFDNDAAALADIVATSGVSWVQLHAFQLPSVARDLRQLLHQTHLTIVKVLHVRGDRCIDLRMAREYERTGVDAFLLDVATADGRVGSTGEAISPEVAAHVAATLNRPFFLAGGLGPGSWWRYRFLTYRPGFVGIDVSTSARDADGRLGLGRIQAINHAWRGHATREADVALR